MPGSAEAGTSDTTDEPGETGAAPARRRRRQRSAATLWTVRGLAVVAAVLSLLSDAAPTGTTAVDGLWRAAGAAGLALASSRATRGPWLWMATVAALAAVGGGGVYLAVPALLLVLWSARQQERPRVVGGAIGALCAGALLLLPSWGPHGTMSLVAAVAVAPILPTAYHRSPRRMQRNLRRAAVALVAAVVVAGGAAAVAMGLAATSLIDGVDRAEAGLGHVAGGDQEAAVRDLRRSGDDLERAEGVLSGPWMAPARLVPVLSQHVRTVADVSSAGSDLVRTGEAAARAAPYQELRSEEGQVDLEQLVAMQQPLADTADALRRADATLAEVRSPWLAPPLDEAIDRFADEVADARPDADLAEEGLRVAPSLLGLDGDRRYLVLLTTPAESRNLGGFTGSYAVLEARQGTVDLVRSGGIADLNEGSDPATRSIEGQDEFLVRYGRYQPARFLQNVTASPDMETTADVAGSLYEQVTGEAVDGVMVADPFALAAFLELTGPVDVPGFAEPVTSDSAADLLLREQYVLFDQEAERRDRLEDVGEATFDALTSRTLPGPETLGRVLGPVVDSKHLMFFPFAREEQAFLDRLGALGRFGRPEASDLVSVRTANLRASKIDTFLHRSTTYDATYDARTGQVDATVTVVIRNEAPPGGLPAYILGPEAAPLPPGTASVRAGVYTPLELVRATVGGDPTGVEPQRELGLNVFSVPVTIPAGGETTLEVHLTGTVEGMGDTYRLLASSQPLANPDRIEVRVRPADGAPPLREGRGLVVEDDVATDAREWTRDLRYTAPTVG